MQYEIIPQNSKIDYESIIEGFLSMQDVGERTLQAYGKNVSYFIDWVKQHSVSVTSKREIIEYKQYLIDSGKKPSTVNAYLTAVRRLFEYMESEGICPNVAKYVKSVKTSKDYKKIGLSDLQWIELRESLQGEDALSRRDLLLVTLGAFMGLRTIELSRLDVEDFVEVSGREALMIEGKGSKGEKKDQPIGRRVAELLQSYIEFRGITTGAIFTSLSNNSSSIDSERLSTAGIRYAIKKRFKSIGIDTPLITSHSLRHTFAMSLVKSDVPLLQIQSAMRHNNIESTTIYARIYDKYENAAVDVIDNLC